MKNRFSEEQIIKILDEDHTGIQVEEICRKNNISRYSFYNGNQNMEAWLSLKLKK